MGNPNKIIFNTRTTSTHFVTEYGYTFNNSAFEHDVRDMEMVYGKANVSIEAHDGRKWIVIGQPTIK